MANRATGRLIPFERDGKFGFANEDGELMVKPVFDRIDFDKSSSYMYLIKGTSRFRTHCYYDNYDLICVDMIENLYVSRYFLDINGNVSKQRLSYNYGYAVIEKNGLSGVIDENGRIVVPTQFLRALCFREIGYVINLISPIKVAGLTREFIFVSSLGCLNEETMFKIGDWLTFCPYAYWYYDRERRELVSLDIDRFGRYKFRDYVKKEDYMPE